MNASFRVVLMASQIMLLIKLLYCTMGKMSLLDNKNSAPVGSVQGKKKKKKRRRRIVALSVCSKNWVIYRSVIELQLSSLQQFQSTTICFCQT